MSHRNYISICLIFFLSPEAFHLDLVQHQEWSKTSSLSFSSRSNLLSQLRLFTFYNGILTFCISEDLLSACALFSTTIESMRSSQVWRGSLWTPAAKPIPSHTDMLLPFSSNSLIVPCLSFILYKFKKLIFLNLKILISFIILRLIYFYQISLIVSFNYNSKSLKSFYILVSLNWLKEKENKAKNELH